MQLWASGKAVSEQNPEKWPLEANLFLTLSIHFADNSMHDSESFKMQYCYFQDLNTSTTS